jgi:hypothetical protein
MIYPLKYGREQEVGIKITFHDADSQMVITTIDKNDQRQVMNASACYH